MTRSLASNSSPSFDTVSLVGRPAGTITQATRGGCSFSARSSRVSAVSAPYLATASRASAPRSKPTTSWPLSIRRRDMLAPILPSPIIPILMALLLCSSLSVLGDLVEVGGRHAEHTAPVGEEALPVADGLGGDERAEVVVLPRDRHLGGRAGGHDLEGHDRVGTALVQLAGRVEEARAVAGRRGDPAVPVPDPAPQPFERGVAAVGEVGLHRDVVARAELLLEPGRDGGGLLRRSLGERE